MLLLCSPLLAQNDFLADDAPGTLIGLSYMSQTENDGYWLTTGYTTDGKFNLGGNFGIINVAPGKSALIFEPELSYIILKPQAPWIGLGSRISLAARIFFIESEALALQNQQTIDRLFKFSSSIFYNQELSGKIIIQPKLFAGVSFRRLKIWDDFRNSLTRNATSGLIGATLSTYLTFSDTRTLKTSINLERVGKTTSYTFSLSFINEWVGIY